MNEHGGESELLPLSPAAATLVRGYLVARDRPAKQLGDGVVVTPLRGTDFDSPWQLWLATTRSNHPRRSTLARLVTQVRASHRVPRERWPSAITACNTWNASSPLSKAWLAVDDWDTAADGGLVLEASVPIDDTTTQEVVDGFLDTLTRDAVEFWRALLPRM